MTIARKSSPRQLTSGRLLAANILWNLAGQAAPLLVAIFAIPVLIRGLGTNKFGVLAIALLLIGYFGFFDLGLGRALTQVVAHQLGKRQDDDIAAVVRTSLLLMLFLGIGIAVLMISVSPWLVGHALKMPLGLQQETLGAFYLLALSMPAVILTTGLRGLLEANQRFGAISVIRIGMGLFTYLGSVAVLPFSRSIFVIVLVLVIGRFATCFVHFLLCLYAMPALGRGIGVRWGEIPPILRMSGWMTVSNIVGPLLVYIDRFLIGAILSVAAVAYYATPYELITKLLVVPAAITGVLFPAFAASLAENPKRTTLLFNRGVKYTLLAVFPIVFVAVALAHVGLTFWLGPTFAANSTVVVQWLAIGIFANSVGYLGFTLVQSVGRPDLTAKLHIFELLLYVPLLVLLIHTWGIGGAAVAWAARATLDALILFVMARRLLRVRQTIWPGAAAIGASITALLLGLPPIKPLPQAALVVLVLLAFGIGSWLKLLSPAERALARLSFGHRPTSYAP
jgi:O-antigen/teichoic acid export membrane protein